MQGAVDMSPILEALARRRGGGAAPAMDQVSGPMGASPTGGPSTPVAATPQMPQGNPGNMPQQVQSGNAANNAALKASQTAQGPQFDPETRDLAKALVQRLLKGL
jgi:hypothetical protein